MTKQTEFNALVVVISLGMAATLVTALLLMQCSESFGATSVSSGESVAKLDLSLSSQGSPTSVYHRREPLSPGPGSYCGTLSLTYVCRQLGIEASPAKIAELLNDKGTGVSMLDLARAAKSLGLKTEGIRTDFEGLKALAKPIIAFLPESKHFVVVSKADDRGITCIDLAGPITLAWHGPEEFASEWNGEVLAFSNARPESYTPLDEGEMAQYIGGCGGTCTNIVQNAGVYQKCENISNCWETDYYTLFQRYGCAAAESGSCSERSMSRGHEDPCKQGNGPLECEPDFGMTPTLWGSIMACN